MIIKNCTSFKDVRIPRTVYDLVIDDCSSEIPMECIPNELERLKVVECPLFDGNLIPNSVRELHVWICPVFDGKKKLPSQLRIMTVWMCPLFCPTSLPPTLNELKIISCPLFKSVPYSCPNLHWAHLEFEFDLSEYYDKVTGIQNMKYIREKRPKLLNDDCWYVISSFIHD
jgi:hypothetical protein